MGKFEIIWIDEEAEVHYEPVEESHEFIDKDAYDKAVEALKQWHEFEKEQIAKEGSYHGKRINEIISLTEKTLVQLGELNE